jgi:hypothetical protein
VIFEKGLAIRGSGDRKSYQRFLDKGKYEEGNAEIWREYIIRIENLSVL